MKRSIEFTVYGKPKGQPRARAYKRGDRAGVFSPNTADDWKNRIAIAYQAEERQKVPAKASVELCLSFTLERPKSHRTSKGALRKGVSRTHVSKPDVSNLVKLVEDVLTDCGAWADDSQVDELHSSKRWTSQKGQQGVWIRFEWENVEA